MLSSNSVFPDSQPTGSKVFDTDEINNSVSELEPVISQTIENNKKLQEISNETGVLQQHNNSQASDIDIVPLVETVLDDERIEIASRKPASADKDENLKQSKVGHAFTNENKAYVVSTVSTTEAEIETTNETTFEIAPEMVTELSLSAMTTEITVDSNTQVVSTTETLQVRILLHHHRTLNQILINVLFVLILNV